MKLDLPKVALARLEQQGAYVDAAQRATRARLTATCQEHGYPLHDAVIAFEAAYGGLVVPEDPKSGKDEPHWLFGAHACLSSGAHVEPRGGSKRRKLVPVAYSPNDVIYYLDGQGRGLAEDTIEDSSAVAYAADGRALVTRILLDGLFFELQGSGIELPGFQADAWAKRLGLPLIVEASGGDRRFFSDDAGRVLIIEAKKEKVTRVVSCDQNALRSVAPRQATPDPLLGPFAAGPNVRVAFQKLTQLPDVFDRLPLLEDLDAGGNELTTAPSSLWRAPALTKLDLSHNPLRVLPDDVGEAKKLKKLLLRGCPIQSLPAALACAKNLEELSLAECAELDVDQALSVIAQLPKLKKLRLPLTQSLTSLAPLAGLPLQKLELVGWRVERPDRLPAGLGQLKKLIELTIDGADEIALLPEAREDVRSLRLLFNKRFTDEDIRKSARLQPKVLYLTAYANTL